MIIAKYSNGILHTGGDEGVKNTDYAKELRSRYLNALNEIVISHHSVFNWAKGNFSFPIMWYSIALEKIVHFPSFRFTNFIVVGLSPLTLRI